MAIQTAKLCWLVKGQEEEDAQGKPFVGDAGILLNKMLDAIKIKRENIYITNVVNYRPNNRKPEI